jgi:hypothetical protein
MGTWSRPLFVRVSHGAPADYIARKTPGWEGTGFFEDSGTTCTLEEFMQTGCDSHQILDHMDYQKERAWRMMCGALFTEYPALEWVEFHFYSRDAQMAYCLRFVRGEERLMLCKAGSQDPLFMQRRGRTWTEWWNGRTVKEVETWHFLEAAYRRNVEGIFYRRTVYESIQDVSFWRWERAERALLTDPFIRQEREE